MEGRGEGGREGGGREYEGIRKEGEEKRKRRTWEGRTVWNGGCERGREG